MLYLRKIKYHVFVAILSASLIFPVIGNEKQSPELLAWWGTIYPQFCFMENPDENEKEAAKPRISFLDYGDFPESGKVMMLLLNFVWHLHAPLCGIFHPNSVVVAHYDALIQAKSSTNCDAHLAERLLQTWFSAGLTNTCKPGALVLKWGNRMEEI